eukprot:6185661-Pleurochrysis_carterae.AAC.1
MCPLLRNGDPGAHLPADTYGTFYKAVPMDATVWVQGLELYTPRLSSTPSPTLKKNSLLCIV